MVDRWNKRRLDASVKLGVNYTLNQRFQLSENIRLVFKGFLCIKMFGIKRKPFKSNLKLLKSLKFRASALVYRASTFGCVGSVVVVSLVLAFRFVETNTQGSYFYCYFV